MPKQEHAVLLCVDQGCGDTGRLREDSDIQRHGNSAGMSAMSLLPVSFALPYGAELSLPRQLFPCRMALS